MTLIKASSTIGILGGGQLGRMLALAAAPMGYKIHIFCPEKNSSAFGVADAHSVASYDDHEALEAFAQAVDVVTYEFENIPVSTAERINQHALLRPGITALTTAQDREREKRFLRDTGIAVAPFAPFSNAADLAIALTTIGTPAIAKTRKMGYDGKGQFRLNHTDDSAAALTAMQGQDAILEGFVRFSKEISVIIARNPQGHTQTFAIAENIHKNHILDSSTVPAAIDDDLAEQARETAKTVITALDYVGVLTIEMFVVDASHSLLVNEIAPRVHNSGHWTIEGARCSQFTQHIRAICGLPLGDPQMIAPATMKNLLGDAIYDIDAYLRDPKAHVHHYGKTEARAGRKMGHVTWVDV